MSFWHPTKERADGRKVRYAVIGAGWIAQEDMPGVAKTGNSAVAALDPEKAQELAEEHEMAQVCDYNGFDTLLRLGKIDAIYLATPNSMHRDFDVRALEAGIHVLCEKPMAPTIDDCRAMMAASEKRDLLMTPGFTFAAGQTLALTSKEKTDETKYEKVDQLAGETKYFSDCVLDDRDPEPDGEERLCDICEIKAIEKSIVSGRPEPGEQVARKKRPGREQTMKLPASEPPELVDAKPASK